jgi:hypothetical protein
VSSPVQPIVSVPEYLSLRNGYYRRLLNLNDQISVARKRKICVKAMNEERKDVNRSINLLEVYVLKPTESTSVDGYRNLLSKYKE